MYKNQFESVHFTFTPWKYQYYLHPSTSLLFGSSNTSSSVNLEYVKSRRTRAKNKHQDKLNDKHLKSKKLLLSKNYHHAQPQAITSIVYRCKGNIDWLMLFDIDEYAFPRLFPNFTSGL